MGYPALCTAQAWSATPRARRGDPSDGLDSLGERRDYLRRRPMVRANSWGMWALLPKGCALLRRSFPFRFGTNSLKDEYEGRDHRE